MPRNMLSHVRGLHVGWSLPQETTFSSTGTEVSAIKDVASSTRHSLQETCPFILNIDMTHRCNAYDKHVAPLKGSLIAP